ncbi:ribokinase [Maribacter litopenaei]|uniref:Ribokinase n=1 Tax=Maribacter litopenaei TaxID=2976127 RepID=A0ABY5Y8Z8_9FLAO|nr:ribokinase [Maribacter litopenaei]UWX55311.1 ribokinase [Maribacter litopenaei]
MKRLYVVGSSNTDMVVRTDRFPVPGETIMGGDFYMFPGGKGANQAVAATRAGGNVHFICSLGDDLFGKNAINGYIKEGIDVSRVQVILGKASGVALITVNNEGENEIVVAPGTNAELSGNHLENMLKEDWEDSLVLTQLETPIETLIHLSKICKEKKWPLILNPAPAQELPKVILDGLFLITPNETEAKLLTGITVRDEPSAMVAASSLMDSGVKNVIITMGSKGAFFKNAEESFFTSAQKVKVVDTTAAGDVFNGVLAVGLTEGLSWKNSIIMATKAAGISVAKMGAQDSVPYKEEFT